MELQRLDQYGQIIPFEVKLSWIQKWDIFKQYKLVIIV